MVTQKEAMQWCGVSCDYHQWDTIEMYAMLEERGDVPRVSDITPKSSRAYATILWHTAIKLEWFDEDV